MRTALLTAAVTEKALAAKESEVHDLKARLVVAETAGSQVVECEAKIAALEIEITNVRKSQILPVVAHIVQLKQAASAVSQPVANGHALPSTPTGREPRPRMSTGSAADDPEKKLRGFQHIIQELSGENAELKEKYESVLEEVGLLKEVRAPTILAMCAHHA